MKAMCDTCPWREGSPFANLKEYLSDSARQVARICHSTGQSVIKGNTGKAERLCRGARDEQIDRFYKMGFLSAPTDEAWEAKCKEMGL